MLFLPIDNSIFERAQQRKRVASRRKICKSSLVVANYQTTQGDYRTPSNLLENIAKRSTVSPSNSQNRSFTPSRAQTAPNTNNAYENIQKHSRDAQDLIDYMRRIQQGRTQVALENLDHDYESYGMTSMSSQTQQPTNQRVLTTMSPSTKERLKKNLETFGSDHIFAEPKEKQMAIDADPPPITKMILPNHTKHAYSSYAQTQAVRRQSANCHRPSVQSAMTAFDGGVVPYTRDLNDETLLFVQNASKPLVDGLRKVKNVSKPRTTILNRVLHQKSEKSGLSQQHQQLDLEPIRKYTPALATEPTSGNLSTQKQNSMAYQSLKQLQKKKEEDEKKAARNKMRLMAQQRKESAALTAGSSRHISVSKRKKSHEECKFLFQHSRDEDELRDRSRSRSKRKEQRQDPLQLRRERRKFVQRDRSWTPNTRLNPCCEHGHSLKIGKIGSQDTSGREPKELNSFTVKLCVKCKRSVKFKKVDPTPKPRGKKSADRAQLSPPKITQYTQVDEELSKQFRRQNETQTKVLTAKEAYTQSEVPKFIDQSTRMSRDEKECEAQTSHRLNIDRNGRRPYTSLAEERKQRRKLKTFNLVDVQAQHAEFMNGRRFVIYSREEYDSFMNSRERKRRGESHSQTTINMGPSSFCNPVSSSGQVSGYRYK